MSQDISMITDKMIDDFYRMARKYKPPVKKGNHPNKTQGITIAIPGFAKMKTRQKIEAIDVYYENLIKGLKPNTIADKLWIDFNKANQIRPYFPRTIPIERERYRRGEKYTINEGYTIHPDDSDLVPLAKTEEYEVKDPSLRASTYRADFREVRIQIVPPRELASGDVVNLDFIPEGDISSILESRETKNPPSPPPSPSAGKFKRVFPTIRPVREDEESLSTFFTSLPSPQLPPSNPEVYKAPIKKPSWATNARRN